MNYLINRVKPYNPKGRNQTEEESDELKLPIINLMVENGIPFEAVNGDTDGYSKIVNWVIAKLKVKGVQIID